MRRIAVWFNDNTICTVTADGRTEKQMMEEAHDMLEGANKGHKGPKRKAVIVEFELPDSAMHEIV